MKKLLLLVPCVVLLLGAEPAPDTAKLIRQLGSPKFTEREAASRQLERLPEALEPLRLAAKSDKDAEVRRRARLLLSRVEKCHMDDLPVGQWRLVGLTRYGRKQPLDHSTWLCLADEDKFVGGTAHIRCRFDRGTHPARVRVTFFCDGPLNCMMDRAGTYIVEGGWMRIWLTRPGMEPPTDLNSRPGEGDIVYALERVPEKKNGKSP